MKTRFTRQEAEDLHDQYIGDGKTLREVASKAGCEAGMLWRTFARYGLSTRKQKRLPYVERKGRRYTVDDTGYYRTTTNPRGYLHRHIWEDANGPIPEGHEIHHKDEDTLNNNLENLECVTKGEHARLHRGGTHFRSHNHSEE